MNEKKLGDVAFEGYNVNEKKKNKPGVKRRRTRHRRTPGGKLPTSKNGEGGGKRTIRGLRNNDKSNTGTYVPKNPRKNHPDRKKRHHLVAKIRSVIIKRESPLSHGCGRKL